MFKIQVKQKNLIKKKHMLYQLSTHIHIEKKKMFYQKKKKKTLPVHQNTPHVEITLSTHHKQKVLRI